MIATIQANNIRCSLSLELLKKFINDERLRHTNFSQFDQLLAIIAYEYRKDRVSKEDIVEISAGFDMHFLENTLHGRGFLKPNGYPVDYLFLDRIYINQISSNPRYGVWNKYVQQNGAPNAVRNRKEYFKHLVKVKAKSVSQINILNIISGSGGELAELYDDVSIHDIHTTCVEIDEQAIAFSKKIEQN